mgnify:CR=1 FL=1
MSTLLTPLNGFRLKFRTFHYTIHKTNYILVLCVKLYWMYKGKWFIPFPDMKWFVEVSLMGERLNEFNFVLVILRFYPMYPNASCNQNVLNLHYVWSCKWILYFNPFRMPSYKWRLYFNPFRIVLRYPQLFCILILLKISKLM